MYGLTKELFKIYLEEEKNQNPFITDKTKSIMSRTPLGRPDSCEQKDMWWVYPSYYLNVLINLKLGNIDRTQARWMLGNLPNTYQSYYGDEWNPLLDKKYNKDSVPKAFGADGVFNNKIADQVIPNFEWFECWGDVPYIEFSNDYWIFSRYTRNNITQATFYIVPYREKSKFRKLSKPIPLVGDPDFNTVVHIMPESNEPGTITSLQEIKYNRIDLADVYRETKKSAPGYMYYLDSQLPDINFNHETQGSSYLEYLTHITAPKAHLAKRFNIMFGGCRTSADRTSKDVFYGGGVGALMTVMARFFPDTGCKLQPFLPKQLPREYNEEDYAYYEKERQDPPVWALTAAPLFYFIKKNSKTVTIRATPYNYLYTGEMDLPHVGIPRRARVPYGFFRPRMGFRYDIKVRDEETGKDKNVSKTVVLPVGRVTINADDIPEEDRGNLRRVSFFGFPNIADRAFYGNRGLYHVDLTSCGVYIGHEAFGLDDGVYNEDYLGDEVIDLPSYVKEVYAEEEWSGNPPSHPKYNEYHYDTGRDFRERHSKTASKFTKTIEFGLGVKFIGDNVFKNQWWLSNVEIKTIGHVHVGEQKNWHVYSIDERHSEDKSYITHLWNRITSTGFMAGGFTAPNKDTSMKYWYAARDFLDDMGDLPPLKNNGWKKDFEQDKKTRAFRTYRSMMFAKYTHKVWYNDFFMDLAEVGATSPTAKEPNYLRRYTINDIEVFISKDKELWPTERALMERIIDVLKWYETSINSLEEAEAFRNSDLIKKYDYGDDNHIAHYLFWGNGLHSRTLNYTSDNNGPVNTKGLLYKSFFEDWQDGEIFTVDQAIF